MSWDSGFILPVLQIWYPTAVNETCWGVTILSSPCLCVMVHLPFRDSRDGFWCMKSSMFLITKNNLTSFTEQQHTLGNRSLNNWRYWDLHCICMVCSPKKPSTMLRKLPWTGNSLTENTVQQNLQTETKLLTRSVDWTAIELLQAQQHYFPLVDILMSQH